MNLYTLTLLALLLGLAAQAVVAGLSLEMGLRRELPRPRRLAWLALGCGGLLLALHHGYWLELAVRTGLHDFDRAVLAALSGLFTALAVVAFRRS